MILKDFYHQFEIEYHGNHDKDKLFEIGNICMDEYELLTGLDAPQKFCLVSISDNLDEVTFYWDAGSPNGYDITFFFDINEMKISGVDKERNPLFRIRPDVSWRYVTFQEFMEVHSCADNTTRISAILKYC